MAKLLIGCYSFSSNSNYGTKYTNVVTWVKGAVEELEQMRSHYSAQLDTDNAFQAIFVAPEYIFTDENTSKSRQPMPKQCELDVVRDLKAISKSLEHILMFPGSIFYKEPLSVDVNLQKMQANLLAAEFNLKRQGKDGVVTSTRVTGGGTKIPSLQEASKAAKPKADTYRAFNTVRAFLGGDSVMTPYNKQWDFKETEGASVEKLVYIPGSAVGTREIRKFNFGVEVCFDHGNAALKGNNPGVDFHVVVSDYVETKESNMAMGNGGYFIHASSKPNQTCVYKRNSMGGLQKLTKTAGKVEENQMAYWLVDVDKRNWDKPDVGKPTGTTVNIGGKVLTGAKKVM